MRLYLPIIPTIQKCQTHRKNADGKQNKFLWTMPEILIFLKLDKAL